MLTVAQIVFYLFAALLILGGIAGYVEAKSVISLIAGLVCGGLGLWAAILLHSKPQLALVIGLVGAILAAGGMAPRVKDKVTGAIHVWPAAIVLGTSVVTAVVAVAALATSRGATPPPGVGQ